MKSTIYSLQILRALAALGVVLFHLSNRTVFQFYDNDPEAGRILFGTSGGVGVEIFFVLSGFIIGSISADLYGKNGAIVNFLARRIIRVVPIYWICTMAVIAMKLAAGNSENISIIDVLQSFFFWPMPGRPILDVGWTLIFEMMFYAIFALSLFLPNQKIGFVATTLVIFCVFLAGRLSDIWEVTYLGRPLIFLFIVGMWAALFREKFNNIPIRLPLSVLILVYLFMINEELLTPSITDNFTFNFIASSLLVLACIFLKDIDPVGPLKSGLVALGDASYSLYLTHSLVFRVTGEVWERMFGTNYLIAFYLISLAASIAFAIFSYHYVEKPMLKAGYALIQRKGWIQSST